MNRHSDNNKHAAIHSKHQASPPWDPKGSISTISTVAVARPYNRRSRATCSILSSDSDIRFTRKKLSSNVKCGCYILASFLIFLLILAVFVYFTYTYLIPATQSEQIFRGKLKIIDGDAFTNELADSNTPEFRNRSRVYRDKFNALYRRSSYGSSFIGSEILAFDGDDGKDLIVHFNLHFDPRYDDVYVQDLLTILQDETSGREYARYFRDVTIDAESVQLKEHFIPVVTPAPQSTIQTTTVVVEVPRQCIAINLNYCKHLPYNYTSYPNLMGHDSLEDVESELIKFRELVDGECSRNAYDFVCQILQPQCVHDRYVDKNILRVPCRSFCQEFMSECGGRLSEQIKSLLDCSRFPEFTGFGSCQVKPGCIKQMQSRAMSPRLCDGVADCEDASDETTCSYCPNGYMHCGLGRKCIKEVNRCDGKQDCPDGSDERACLSIAPSLNRLKQFKSVSSHQNENFNEGHVVFNERGQFGKLCVDNIITRGLNGSLLADLETIATSLCKSLSFETSDNIRIEDDPETSVNTSYVKMKDPRAEEITFVRTSCSRRKVLHVKCSQMVCGLQPLHLQNGIEGLSKMAQHGHWPWHVALLKEDVHVCDATLVSANWLITTASCFQGQPKAQWIAKFGVIRLTSASPWQQTRRIVGMVKSPVEGSTIVLIKLEQPVRLNDFIRPICLPKSHMDEIEPIMRNHTQCNTVGWARNREHLQRVQVQLTNMHKCENVSIPSVNSVCTESPFNDNDCNEEEFAGSALMCLMPDVKRWALVGVSNWRIACSSNGVDRRPRLYDKISSNIEWIREIISAIS